MQYMLQMSTGPQLLGSISSAPTGVQENTQLNDHVHSLGRLGRFVYENIYQSVRRSPANSRYPTYVFDKGRRHARSLFDMFTR